MSSKKDKYLASAQKYIQKGQFDRALKDYEQVVTADPKDVKHRQKLAELMVRCSRRDDAIREYETIARYYDENGFYLKSIAVYKQIQRLDPSNLAISLSLAALNEKQGMIGNALSEYKTVFDHYEKSGLKEEAIKVLEKMQAVDPENIEIRLKLAETCFAAGAADRAYQEYTRAALALKGRGDIANFDRVCRRIQQFFPDRADSMVDLLEEQIRGGVAGDALPRLEQLLQDDPDNTRVLALLAEAYRIAGEHEKQTGILRHILTLAPDDIDAVKGLINASVEGKDLEGSLSLLDQYLPLLFSAGAYGEVEHYFTSLQNHDPYEIRLLTGLKQLYELTGESSKLADVQVSLNILSQRSASGAHTASWDAGGSTAAGSPAGGAGAEPAEFSWGGEIDLSNLAEISTEQSLETPDQVEEISLEEPVVAAEPVVEAEPQDFEIDISFDFPDGAELFSSPESREEAVPDGEASLVPEEPKWSAEVPGGTPTEPEFIEEVTLELEEIPEEGESDVNGSRAVPGPDGTPSFPWVAPPAAVPPPLRETDSIPEDRDGGVFTPLAPVEPLPSNRSEPGASTGKYTFDGMFAKFKEGLGQQVDSGDTETHYSLGIAYMEMGLYDDAVSEFGIAGSDPGRMLDCLTLQGVCCREKGDYEGAERILNSGLSIEGLDSDRVLSLRYELALLYEAAGRGEEALRVFRDIFVVNPGFRNTMGKIALLSGNKGALDLSGLDEVDIELEEIER